MKPERLEIGGSSARVITLQPKRDILKEAVASFAKEST
jgi:hypothetical protein